MTQIGIMIEGQDGLTWERWTRVLKIAEDFGFQCLFRSDHYTNAGPPDKDSLELWVSLTYAATHTNRIEFGPLVTPVTFRHPTMTARMAAAVDDLSNGRLVLGLGAGWQEREHQKFGVPFHDFPTRYNMLTEALEVTKQLFYSDEPVNYQGKHFSLVDAIMLPRPSRKGGPPLLIGGNGPNRTLPLVAKYADEWNAVYLPVKIYKERRAQLEELLERNGRAFSDVKRSLMTGTVFGRDDAALKAAIRARSQQSGQDFTIEALIERGLVVGSPTMWIDQIGKLAEPGVERFMLQWLDWDDLDGLEVIAEKVLPPFH